MPGRCSYAQGMLWTIIGIVALVVLIILGIRLLNGRGPRV